MKNDEITDIELSPVAVVERPMSPRLRPNPVNKLRLRESPRSSDGEATFSEQPAGMACSEMDQANVEARQVSERMGGGKLVPLQAFGAGVAEVMWADLHRR